MRSIINVLIILAFILGSKTPTFSQNSEQLYQKGLIKEEGEGALNEAIVLYNQIVENQDAAKSLQAKALLHIGMCYEKMGKQEATNAYQRLVNNYPSQKYEVAIAKERLSRLIQIEKLEQKEKPKPAKEPEGIRIEQVWSGPEVDNSGSVSADGEYLSFVNWDTGDLAIRNLNTKQNSSLVSGSWDTPMQYAQYNVISPDGKQIAYSWYNHNASDLYLINIDNPFPKLLYRKRGVEVYPVSWLSDKEIIVTIKNKGADAQIASYSILDGTIEVLKTFDQRKWARLTSSPDENYIAYDFANESHDGTFDINILSMNGKGEIALVEHPANDRVLGWMPERNEFLFISDRSGTWDLWAIAVDNGTPFGQERRIYTDIGEVGSMGFTQRGDCYIGFSKRNFNSYIAPINGETGEINEKSGRSLLGSNFWVKWSPDGQYLYYIREDGNSKNPWQLTIQNLKTGVERKLANNLFLAMSPCWSPDGNSILVVGIDKNEYRTKGYKGGIYKVDIASGETTEIFLLSDYEYNTPKDDAFPLSDIQWSADGKSFFYLFFKDRLVKHNLETGEEEILYQQSHFDSGVLTLSPDGKKLLIAAKSPEDKKSQLFTLSVEGGEEKVLCSPQETNHFEMATWSPDGKYIYFSERSDGTSLWRITAEGGIPQKVWHSKKRVEVFSIHPDGKQIALAIRERTTEIRVIKGLVNELEKLKVKDKKAAQGLAEEQLKEGNRLFDLWEYKLAIEEYESAIELDPNSFLAQNAHYRIGQSWFKEGKYDIALTTFENLIKEFPKSYIIPVTELMIAQVKLAIKENQQTESIISVDENKIIDSKTGITYRKIKSFTGKNDWIDYTSGGFNMTSDCRFMVLENKVVPTDGSEPFKLVDMNALRGVYSPDMSKAAFYADSAIWMVPISPESGQSIGSPKKLLEGNYKYQGPVSWSPDGTKIAFMMRDDSIAEDIWTISISDLSLTRLTESLGTERSPVWSPNGNTMVYNSEGTIWQTTESMDEPKLIAKNHGRAIPRWSPDGKWLYLISNNDNYLYSFEDKKEFKLRPPKQIGRFCSFTPDGEELLFYRTSYDVKWDMSVISSLGGPSYKPLLNSEVYSSQWSKDSKKMLAQSVNIKGDIVYKIIPFGGGSPIEVKLDVKVNGKVRPFAASQDLTHIIFSVKQKDGSEDLYIVPFSIRNGRNTGPSRLIFEAWNEGAYNVNISWSPDGSKLALVHKGNIWIVPLDGEDPTQITDTPEEKRWVAWSPNGKMISYIIQPGQKGSLYVMSAKGENTAIVSKDCELSKWTLDSKSLAVVSGHKLSIIGLNGEKIDDFELAKEIELDQISVPSFNPNGKSFAIIAYNGEKATIYTYSFKTKEYTPIGDDIFKYDLQWSHDGQWISYLTYQTEKVRPEGTLWEADFAEIKEKLLLNK